MSKLARKLDRWIANADEPEDLAEALASWFDEDPDEDEIEEMTLEIATRLMPDEPDETEDEADAV
ncbi:hypothetical protein I6F11_23400 [Ensifer sp. NBAIM29]|nr:hypothetical protein [Ensifer sp. NBAIM29]